MNHKMLSKMTWLSFQKGMRKNLGILKVTEPREFMRKAKKEYKRILSIVPDYRNNDIFLTNLLNAACLASVYLTISEKPSIETMKTYFGKMMSDSFVMKIYFRQMKGFTKKYQKDMEKTADRSQHSTNPYTWKCRFEKGEDINTYSIYIDQCGICLLFHDLGIPELVPVFCSYDYVMATKTNTIFTREKTLAGGDKVCDCHYRKKE